MKFHQAFILFLLVLSSCKNEDDINLSPSAVDINIEVTTNTAVVSWSMSEDPEMQVVKYEILLDGISLGLDLTTNTYTLVDLNYRQSYTVELKAYTDAQDASTSMTTFDTEHMMVSYGGSANDFGYGAIHLDDGSKILGTTAHSVDNGFGTLPMTLIKVDPKGNKEWLTTFGESYHKMTGLLKTTDNNIVVLAGNMAFKFDLDGNELWSNMLGQAQYRNVINTADGGYLLSGSVNVPTQKKDGSVLKISSSGTIEWSTNIGGSQDEFLYQAVQHIDGTYTIVGHTYSHDGDILDNDGFAEALLIRLSKTGSKVWVNTIQGTGTDFATAILEVNGEIYISGFSTSTGYDYPDITDRQLFVAKISNTGNVTWINKIGSTGGDDFVRDMMYSDDGHLYVLAEIESDGGDISVKYDSRDIWVAKINLAGELVNDYTFGGSGSDTAWDIYPLSGAFQFGIVGESNSTDHFFEGNPDNSEIILIEY